jgi:hypothetical protein
MLDLQKELEFYRWEGNLSQLQKNVRDKINQVASVRPLLKLLVLYLLLLLICCR